MLIDEYTSEELLIRCNRYEQLTKEIVVSNNFTNLKEYTELDYWFREAREEIERYEDYKTMCIMFLLVGVFWFAFLLAIYLRT